MTAFELQLRNFMRWIIEYWVSWFLLTAIYSASATLFLQPVLEKYLHRSFEFIEVWLLLSLLLLIPGLLSKLNAGGIQLRLFPVRGLAALYFVHMFRRGVNWIAFFGAAALMVFLPLNSSLLGIFIVQIPLQVSLFSMAQWVPLAFSQKKNVAAKQLIFGVGVYHVFLTLLLVLIRIIVLMKSGVPFVESFPFAVAAIGTVLGGSAVCLEGDSGKPWIVNFISLTLATFLGFLCQISSWWVIASVIIFRSMSSSVESRLKSVEFLDEDVVIS